MVCKHINEWSAGDEDYIEEVKTFYDNAINEASDDTDKDELKSVQQERVETLQKKIGKLTWWKKVKIEEQEQETEASQNSSSENNRPYVLNCDDALICKTILLNNNITCPQNQSLASNVWCPYGSSTDLTPKIRKLATAETNPVKAFPTSNNVFHFHPLAFVEQMKRVNACVIEVIRKWTYWTGINSTSATISEFSVLGTDIVGYITEPYGPDSIESGKDKRIPIGEYNLKWYTSSKFPKNKYQYSTDKYIKSLKDPCLKYGFPNVYNDQVASSRGILIHIGKEGKHTEGCLVLGKKLLKKTENNVEKIIGVDESPEQFYTLIAYIEAKGIENIKLLVKEDYE